MPWISCPCERLYCNNEREREKKRERPGVREEKRILKGKIVRS